MANICGVEVSTGSQFFRETDTPDTYEEVTGITEYPQFSFTHGTASCDDDGASGWATNYSNGKKDMGETSITVNWMPGDTVHDNLYVDFESLDERNYRIVWPDTSATTLTFAANMTSYGIATPAPASDDKRITREIGLNISGAPTWA